MANSNAAKRVDNRPRMNFAQRIPFFLGLFVFALVLVLAVDHMLPPFLQEDAPFIHDFAWSMPLTACAGYLILVHLIDPWWRKKAAKDSDAVKAARDQFWVAIMKVWNQFLTILSMCMLVGLAYGLIQNAIQDIPRAGSSLTMREFYCDAKQTRWSGSLFLWIYIFDLSKYAELFDTVILVARSKPVNLLHWYHHTTVLLFTWWAINNKFSVGYLFGMVNAFVHTIMYDYYKISAYKIKLTYDKVLTSIQLIQMVIGILITGTWVVFWLQDPSTCPTDNVEYMVAGATLMYASYLYLFGVFFYGRYIKGQQAKAAKKAADAALKKKGE